MTTARVLTAAVVLTAATAATGAAAMWGSTGHTLVAAAATADLPTDMPAFFRGAAPQLHYLNPEPDRWRDREAREMDEAFKYDHYVDLENLPPGALDASDRYEYIEALYRAGLDEPEQDAGFLPFRIIELHQRLASGFARWRTATSERERGWIEQRIINDAGVLGHYVGDASNPHHTTIHFNGWAEGAPNPRGYTTSRDFHWRFETPFVEAHVTLDEVLRHVPAGARVLDDVRAAVIAYIHDTNAEVESLYRIERRSGFTSERAAPDAEAFAIARLAAGADMLRAVWYTAWVESEALAARDR